MAVELFPYLGVVARAAGLLGSMPVLGGFYVPRLVRVALALLVALALYPAVAVPYPEDLFTASLWILSETLTGLAIGFLAQILFSAFQMAGSLLDLDLGLGVAGLLDPVGHQPVSILGNFFNLVASLLYFWTGAYAVPLMALRYSFQGLPAGGFFAAAFFPDMERALSTAFLAAVQLALPVIAVSFVVTVAMAVFARAIPQMNVFLLGLPLKIALGFLALGLLFPAYRGMMEVLFPGEAALLLPGGMQP
ncbi:MAG: flagellar biosynthetic protein FliR [Clostridiales bacterium]|nr:flagellar biosynthetic protein FliR [Clostridiales bacterium]